MVIKLKSTPPFDFDSVLAGFQSVLKLVDNTCRDSFDLFYGLYKFNTHSYEQIQRLREAFANVERQLAAKEAYLAARSEVSSPAFEGR